MKKIIRLTESELRHIIENTTRRIVHERLNEDVLGDNWHEKNTSALNNYEPFEDQKEDYSKLPFGNEPPKTSHDWSGQGEVDTDRSFQEPRHNDAIGWNDDEAEGYEDDPDAYRNDVTSYISDLPDSALYGE